MAAISAMVMLPLAVAGAQWNVSQYEAGRSWVYASYGLDPAFVATLGYARAVRGNVQLSAEAGSVVAKPDLGDSRVVLGVKATALRWRSVRLTGSGTAITRQTSNTIYRAVSFGSAFTGTLGVYRNRWFAATEGGFDKSVITKITHTDLYRNVYPEVKDGWYMPTGGTYHYGLTGGAQFGRTELVARVGSQRTERYKDLPVPFYVSLGAGVALK
jgi:hypothetical protein